MADKNVIQDGKVLIYQYYPIVWPGGLKQMTEHLKYIKELGVTHVWLSPIYPSPRDDMGYDVSDYYKVDRRIGTLAEFDRFVKTAHGMGIQVLMDMVLNHTSTSHKWFREHPDYYHWENRPIEGWDSLFGGSAWEYDKKQGQFYCHLFAKTQADLDWFPSRQNINQELVQEFRNIIQFWMTNHGVDGFRLDVPQSINKNYGSTQLDMGELISGDKSVAVINAVFNGLPKRPFLLMESLIPFEPKLNKNGTIRKYGLVFPDLIGKYVNEAHVDYVLNLCLKEQRDISWRAFDDAFQESCRIKGFALDVESHDSPRFTSRSGMLPRQIFQMMFTSKAKCIIIYQGQELGLKNPKLSWVDIRELDAQSRNQLIAGKPEEEVLKTCRAYARVPLPIEEYEKQSQDRDSSLNWMKFYAENWLRTK